MDRVGGVVGRLAHALCAAAAGSLWLGGCGPGGGEGSAAVGVPALAWGEAGRFPGQFDYPRAIDAVAAGGPGPALAVVVDKSARVQVLEAATGEPLAWWRMPEWELGKPTGLTIGPNPLPSGGAGPAVWVADTHYHRVLVYELPEAARRGERVGEVSAEPVLSFGRYGEGLGEFIYPTDVALLVRPGAGGRGRVVRAYVSEYGGNDRVTAFEPAAAGGGVSFEPVFAFGVMGEAEGVPGSAEGFGFQRPQSVAVRAPEGGAAELVVVDACNHRVGRFGLDGSLIGWVGSVSAAGDGSLGTFRFPYGLALLADGTALVSEFGGGRVQRVDLDRGVGLSAWGRAGRGEGEFNQPWGLAVVGGEALVLDSRNHRVQSFPSPAPGAGVAVVSSVGEGGAAGGARVPPRAGGLSVRGGAAVPPGNGNRETGATSGVSGERARAGGVR